MNIKSLFVLACLLLSLAVNAAEPKIFEKKGKYGLVDSNTGKVILKAKFDSIYPFNGDYALIKKKDSFGLVKKNGEIYLDCKYKNILFPAVAGSGRDDYFWTTTDGHEYYRRSDKYYNSMGLRYVFYGPDKYWYGMQSNGKWLRKNAKMNQWDHVGKTTEALRKVELSDGFFLFCETLYDGHGKAVATDVKSVRPVTFSKTPMFGISFNKSDGNMIYEIKTGNKWKKDTPGMNGFYAPEKGDDYLSIQGNKIYSLSPFVNSWVVNDPSCQRYGILYDNQMLLPFDYTGIKIDKHAGEYKGQDLWKITLSSDKGIVESDLDELVKFMKSTHDNFIVVVETPMGVSLFGNTGKELVHNSMQKVYTVNGFLCVTENGSDRVVDINGSSDLYAYDTISRSSQGNLTGDDILVSKDGRYGLYVEGKGEVVPPHYDRISRLANHIYVYDGDYVGIYDNDGNKILDAKYRSVDVGCYYPGKFNYYAVRNPNGSIMIVNDNGRVTVPAGTVDRVDFLSGDERKWCKVYKNGKMGILNLETMKIVVPCAYNDQIFFGSGTWPNRKIGVYKSSSQQELIEIWTMSGRKIASKSFPKSARYTMKHYLQSQLDTSLSF